MDAKPPVIFLMGPTASGKTELAVELVQQLPVDIISVDSALIYRRMNIGTAKPGPETLSVAPHRLIDIREPVESYSAAHFRADALNAMQDIQRNGRIPLLVGGTMLYFKALEEGLAVLPASDPVLRERLAQEATESGLPAMHRRLQEIDPRAAARIHQNDPQRLLRALEVYELSGTPLSILLDAQKAEGMPFRAIKFIRAPDDRAILHDRIAKRFGAMLDEGFEQEVRDLMQMSDFTPSLPAMRSVGYRQMITYLQGQGSFEDMSGKAVIATRQLAKRQFTWLQKQSDALWLHDNHPDMVKAVAKSIAL